MSILTRPLSWLKTFTRIHNHLLKGGKKTFEPSFPHSSASACSRFFWLVRCCEFNTCFLHWTSTQQWPAEVKASQHCGSQKNTPGQKGTNQNMWNCSVGPPCSMSVSHMIIIRIASKFFILLTKGLRIIHRDGKIFDLILQNCLCYSLKAHCLHCLCSPQ